MRRKMNQRWNPEMHQEWVGKEEMPPPRRLEHTLRKDRREPEERGVMKDKE